MNEVVSARLHGQLIAGATDEAPGAAVAWMGAAQAQEYASAMWAVGLRCAATIAEVERANADGTIVRTWLLRGTLHFVHAADVRWMLGLVAPRLIAGSARRYRQLELDGPILARSLDVLARALQGGNRLTRDEMMQVLEQSDISTDGQRGYHILRHAGLKGLICFGPRQGNEDTFVLLEETVRPASGPEGEEAPAELAWRYFRSHGPATLQDFAWWSGLRMSDVRAGVEGAGAQLQEQMIDGEPYWSAAGAGVPNYRSPTAYLLPAFDEYYLGYRDRTAVLDPGFDSRVVSSNGVFRPIVVVDGQIVGIWRRSHKGGSAVIDLELFRELTPDEEGAVTVAVERYGAYLGEPVRRHRE